MFQSDPAIFAGSLFVLGLLIGSFLNVVIYRLPIILERGWRTQATEMLAGDSHAMTTPALDAETARFSLAYPPSACPFCKAPIKWYQNVPLVSWLALKGHCAHCQKPISARYPLVELTTGILSAWVAWHFGYGVPAGCALLITWCLIALTGIDIDTQLLPDNITLPLMWAGLLAAAVFGASTASLPVDLRSAVIGAAAGYISLWLVFWAFKLITGKEGMGYGDFKLFAALGAWLGWQLMPLIILLSAASGAFLGIFLIVVRGRDRTVPIPFGPYLAVAGWLAMLYGDALVSGYLRLSGLRH